MRKRGWPAVVIGSRACGLVGCTGWLYAWNDLEMFILPHNSSPSRSRPASWERVPDRPARTWRKLYAKARFDVSSDPFMDVTKIATDARDIVSVSGTRWLGVILTSCGVCARAILPQHRIDLCKGSVGRGCRREVPPETDARQHQGRGECRVRRGSVGRCGQPCDNEAVLGRVAMDLLCTGQGEGVGGHTCT